MAHIDRLFAGLLSRVCRTAPEEEGQGLAEYAMILGLVAVVAVGAFSTFGAKVSTLISGAAAAL